MNSSDESTRVQVVGAVNVDLVVAVPRLPGPGETVVGPRMDRHGGGKGANAAVAAARAGAATELIGAVGADENGESALTALREAGVGVDHVAVDDTTTTGVALIVVDEAGENQIAVAAGANAALDATRVHDVITGGGSAGCVLVSTEIPGDAVVAAVRAAAAADIRCVVNPAPPISALAEIAGYHPILTPNSGECRSLATMLGGPADTLEQAAAALMTATDAPVIVTLGGDGVLVGIPGEAFEHIPAEPTEVVDTTGAGDAFNGTFAARLAAGDAVLDAARTANKAAALAVSRPGARG